MLNFVSVMDLCYLFLEEKLKKGHNEGTVVNVASTAAFHPVPYMSI